MSSDDNKEDVVNELEKASKEEEEEDERNRKKELGLPTTNTTTSPTSPQPQGPLAVKGPWQEYYEKLRVIDAAYMENVMQNATRDEWKIPIEQTDESGEPNGKYVIKTYKRQKISVRRWTKLEEIRAAFAKESDRQKSQELLAEVYWQCAQGYFGMDKNDYIGASWEDMKLAMDACNFRTVRGLPYSPKSSTNSTTLVQPS